MADIEITQIRNTINQLKHMLANLESDVNRLTNADDNVKQCYYAGNSQMATCQQVATTEFQMLGKKAPKYRSVCDKCSDYLVNDNLAAVEVCKLFEQ